MMTVRQNDLHADDDDAAANDKDPDLPDDFHDGFHDDHHDDDDGDAEEEKR